MKAVLRWIFYEEVGRDGLYPEFRVGWIPVGWTAAVAVVVGAIAGVCALVATNVDGRNCAVAQEQMGRDTRWDLFAGCYVQAEDGSYVPLENYRLSDTDAPG